MGSHSLLQGIFLSQSLNPDLLHCRQILYHLSHQGSPKVYLSSISFANIFSQSIGCLFVKKKKKKTLSFKIKRLQDFPSGPVVENLPSNAGHSGLIPSQGTRIPHTLGQLNPHAPVNIHSDSTKTPHSQINKYQLASCFLAAVAEVSKTLTPSFPCIHAMATLILS